MLTPYPLGLGMTKAYDTPAQQASMANCRYAGSWGFSTLQTWGLPPNFLPLLTTTHFLIGL